MIRGVGSPLRPEIGMVLLTDIRIYVSGLVEKHVNSAPLVMHVVHQRM